MELVRLGNAGCKQPQSAVYRHSEELAVQVLFRDFGSGTAKIGAGIQLQAGTAKITEDGTARR